jgi:hypothetical protein
LLYFNLLTFKKWIFDLMYRDNYYLTCFLNKTKTLGCFNQSILFIFHVILYYFTLILFCSSLCMLVIIILIYIVNVGQIFQSYPYSSFLWRSISCFPECTIYSFSLKRTVSGRLFPSVKTLCNLSSPSCDSLTIYKI